MAGFTQVFLKDNSEENIKRQNKLLKEYNVAKRYRFYSENDIILEFAAFLQGKGVFEERFFPRDDIHTLTDFKRYWSPKALGEIFVPYPGTLQFDCYFGRTSKRAMRNIGMYIADNHEQIARVKGSFTTFMERGMTKLERQIVRESGIRDI